MILQAMVLDSIPSILFVRQENSTLERTIVLIFHSPLFGVTYICFFSDNKNSKPIDDRQNSAVQQVFLSISLKENNQFTDVDLQGVAFTNMREGRDRDLTSRKIKMQNNTEVLTSQFIKNCGTITAKQVLNLSITSELPEKM